MINLKGFHALLKSLFLKKTENNKANVESSDPLLQIIKRAQIFSNFDSEQVKRLFAISEQIILSKNTILFNRGDYSDSMYIVVEGELLAFLDEASVEKKIGVVGVGETVGELGVLSRKSRTLSIKAVTDTRLLKIGRNPLLKFWNLDTSIEFQMELIDTIITRSQSNIHLLTNEKRYRHIAIISANDEPIPHSFISQLKKNITDSQKILLVEKENFTLNILQDNSVLMKNLLIKADNDGLTLIFILSEGCKMEAFVMKHIDAIFFIASHNKSPGLNNKIQDLVNHDGLPYVSRKVLVILYPSSDVDKPLNTRAWLGLAKFTNHYNIRQNNDKDIQRLIRYMIEQAQTVVLAGGGSRGWGAIGALKALEEANIAIDAIGGTSAGSLLSASYAFYQNIEKAYEILKPLVESNVNTLAFRNLTYPLVSLTNAKAFTEAIRNIFKDLYAEDSWLPFFSITCDFNAAAEIRQSEGVLWENLRSSCSLPLVFPPFVKDGKMYIDGGILNNFPVDQMHDFMGKKSFIIGVHTSPWGLDEPVYNFPAIMPFIDSLLIKLNIRHRDYNYPRFIDTCINSLLLGSTAKTVANAKMANLLIEPDLMQYSRLGLNQNKIDAVIEIGYQNTKAAIANLPAETVLTRY